MEQNFTIKNITKNSTNLEVDWSDGKKSKFNYLWLRDNCPTAHDKDSRHRMFNILEVSTNIEPRAYKVNDEGKLEIAISNFPSSFTLYALGSIFVETSSILNILCLESLSCAVGQLSLSHK